MLGKLGFNKKNEENVTVWVKTFKLTAIIIVMTLVFPINCKKDTTAPEAEVWDLPVIWLDKDEIEFTVSISDSNSSTQEFQVKNVGVGTLEYNIVDDADFYEFDWLEVLPDSGSSTGNIVVHEITIDKSELEPREDSYTAKITISSNNCYNSPQEINVSLKVTDEPTPTPPPTYDDNLVTLRVSPNSGKRGESIKVTVGIKGNLDPVDAFSADVTYNPKVFEVSKIEPGELTEDWTQPGDGNDNGSYVTVGGFNPTKNPIPVGREGALVEITFKVICNNCKNGDKFQFCLQNLFDDLEGMDVAPCAKFTFE